MKCRDANQPSITMSWQLFMMVSDNISRDGNNEKFVERESTSESCLDFTNPAAWHLTDVEPLSYLHVIKSQSAGFSVLAKLNIKSKIVA